MKWRKAEGSDGVVVEMRGGCRIWNRKDNRAGKSNTQYWTSTRGDEGVGIHSNTVEGWRSGM